MSKNILTLTSNEAIDYMMTSEQYGEFELPSYFDFNPVLDYVRNTIGDTPYDDCLLATKNVAGCDNVNFDILLNKDGRYAVRPLMLCNPYLYYFLVREVCGASNWDRIKDNFVKCTVPHITSCALPIVPTKPEKFHKSTTILNWWNTLEQRSIELSLDYQYMFVTDITNCYGTVNPQSIDWALSRRGTKRATGKNHNIAAAIIRLLADMQQGRNIGIPQGSAIFDLVAEIILSYADLLLHEAIESKMKQGEIARCDYEILRYRDDYRIFCNDKSVLESISYTLQAVLESLNFRMNSNKTRLTHSVITHSIKADKLAYIENTPILNKMGCDFDNNFQKHLLYILMFGRKYPNSGQMRRMMNDLDKRIEERINEIEEQQSKAEEVDLGIPDELDDEYTKPADNSIFAGLKLYSTHRHYGLGNVKALVAIATQIAIENVSLSHQALQVISRMIAFVDSNEAKVELTDKVYNRLKHQANNTYNMLWLQNMTYKIDRHNNSTPYEPRLCRLVMGENVDLWNIDWLKKKYTREFPIDAVVDNDVLEATTGIITFRERIQYDEMCEIDDDYCYPEEITEEDIKNSKVIGTLKPD